MKRVAADRGALVDDRGGDRGPFLDLVADCDRGFLLRALDGVASRRDVRGLGARSREDEASASVRVAENRDVNNISLVRKARRGQAKQKQAAKAKLRVSSTGSSPSRAGSTTTRVMPIPR